MQTKAQTDYQAMYQEKRATLQECLDLIQSGDVIYTTNTYSEPREILSHIHEIAPRVENVKIWKGRSGLYPFMTDPAMKGHIEMYAYFFGPSFYQQALPLGLVEYVPSDLAHYYTVAVSGHPANVAICTVTPMDENGIFHLGTSHASEGLSMQDAIDNHKTIIVEGNPNLHTMRGAQEIPIQAVTKILEVNLPEYILESMPSTSLEKQIGGLVASLVRDGDTIQLGIGGIPNAVGEALMEKRHLGIHTEMFTSSMMKLIQAGAVDGSRKIEDRGLHVCAFAEGVPELYSFLQENPDCVIRSGRDVVSPFVIARQDNMVSINTCLEIDLTGQVCAESIGPKQISGSGGAFCFALGAFEAKNGRGILAFPSRTAKGISKIKSILTPGAVVTTPRNYVDYVVTEQGIAHLKGATIRERAEQLIAIAHPDDRAALTAEARKLMYL
ncbi:MAG: hypothetical protein LUD79_10020 [Oscillospiraceae bacterium]|nr:hypothetical protein [Oscillospiraceae bacterium]